jgi:GDP-4-dehydro-6-deoxy-D-mannose reductase
VLLTGARGFVGRWLTAELESSGHTVIPAPPRRELDLSAPEAVSGVAAAVRAAQPDAVAHLAGMAYGPDATADPGRAIAVNAGGTGAVLAGLDAADSPAIALVVSTGDVYGPPSRLPIREDAPLAAVDAYGRSKVEEERVALDAHARGRRLVIVRSFNHTGPGQREVFAAPALARRVVALKRGEASDIRAGNLDARRDFTDVRDVVRAYRLLLEKLVTGDELGFEPPVVNVGSGRSIAIRDILETLCRLAGVPARVRVDPALLRANDTPEIYADITRLRTLTGWNPTIPLEQTLSDLLASIDA